MLKSVSDNLDHGHVGIGSVVGEVQPCPEAWIVAKLVPKPADWKNTLAQCHDLKFSYLSLSLTFWLFIWLVCVALTKATS